MDYPDGSPGARRRDAALAGAVLVISLILFFLPTPYQAPIRHTLRGTFLRPFLALQSQLVASGASRETLREIRAQRDSLAAVVAAQAALVEENRRLRTILGLRRRAGPEFVAAEVLRSGIFGSGSTFLLTAGSADTVRVGSPVLTAEGLLGVVRSAGENTSLAMDWTHAEFRASAMTADGTVYGIVRPRRGEFREADVLVLTGAPFHSEIPTGTRIVTSGRGGIYPRGIPIGTVIGIEEADTGWRKSYLLRPAVQPAAVTHALVGQRSRVLRDSASLSGLWQVPAAATVEAPPEDTREGTIEPPTGTTPGPGP